MLCGMNSTLNMMMKHQLVTFVQESSSNPRSTTGSWTALWRERASSSKPESPDDVSPRPPAADASNAGDDAEPATADLPRLGGNEVE